MPPGERVDDVFHCPAFDPNKKGEKRCEYPHQKKREYQANWPSNRYKSE